MVWTGGLAWLAGAVWAAPVVFDVPEAVVGPPPVSCESALAIAAEDRALRPDVNQPTTTSPTPSAVPTPEGELRVVQRFEDPRVSPNEVRLLPGGDLDELPVQPLEGTPADLARVVGVFQSADAGARVRMSFFGASHTGGDFFTGELRRVLQTRYGDAGHGFVFPAALYAGYRAHDINLCRSDGWRSDWVGRRGGRGDGLYGFAGASVSSSDPADFGWLETTRRNPQGRRVSSYDVFMLGQPDGGTLLATVDEAPPRALGTLTAEPGLVHVRLEVPDGAHRLTVQPLGDGEVRVFGISAESDGPGVIVDAMGIRGRTARTILDWDDALFVPGVQALSPDLIALAYGTNEAADTDYGMNRYRSELRQVLAKMRTAAPDAACVLLGPSDRMRPEGRGYYAIYGRTAPVAQVQREVGPEFGCVFWDWQAATGGPGSMLAWRRHSPPLAGKDLIHFTQAGYEESARRFLMAVEMAGSPALDIPAGR